MRKSIFGLKSLGCKKTQRSAELFARGEHVIPGGNARFVARQTPHPIYFSHGFGPFLADVDGNHYLDFLNNHTSLIHGHSHPTTAEALHSQVDRGTSFSGPTESEIELAEVLCGRVDTFDRVRFMNSGTEAVMNAIKAARAFTGRSRIAKFEGAFHGSYDPSQASFDAGPDNWGDETAPDAVRYCHGTPAAALADTVIIPFNDLPSTAAILEKHGNDLAAILIDPLPQSIGLIPIDQCYLEFLRDYTSSHNVLLISDEVMSFRLSYEGGLRRFGIDADLYAIGKVIGGGMPIGAVAGPAKFMSVFDPSNGKPLVPQSGTFTGNPMSMVAGASAMHDFTHDACERLEELGSYARAQLNALFKRHQWPFCTTGMGSLFRIHMLAEPPRNYREAYLTLELKNKLSQFVKSLQMNGLIVSATCQFCLSTPMSQDHVDEMVEIVQTSLRGLMDV